VISICIPIYNYDVTSLVKELHRQATILDIPFEILLADDGSESSIKQANRGIASLHNVIYHEMNHNIGRSRIRNVLAGKARYAWLIFMDCDAMCPDHLYLEKYVNAIGQHQVVCGGHSYQVVAPGNDKYLHWLFGTYREIKDYKNRNRNPYHSFMTFNFMISREIFSTITFNESLLGYGHEDTLFGVELKKNNISIKHIDNPLIHLGLQNVDDFLQKTRQGTRNLLKVYTVVKRDSALPEMVKLLKAWAFLHRLRLCRPTGRLIRLFESSIVNNLKGKKPSLLMLDLYKLGCICNQTIRFGNH
jgi:glycosyltransferase involved in cell wall biosynthesis